MIAIPVAQRSGGILKNINLFTKAKLIALISSDGEQQIMENSFTSGRALAEHLRALGVTTLITNHMGSKPYATLNAAGVEIVYRDGSMELEPLLELYNTQQLSAFTADMVHSHSHTNDQHDGCGCH